VEKVKASIFRLGELKKDKKETKRILEKQIEVYDKETN
jgi:hypothetical protein